MLARREQRLAVLRAEIAAGEAKNGALVRQSAELQEAVVAASRPSEASAVLEVGEGRRSAAAVAAAVGAAPGLTEASAEARAALIANLQSGACVTDALSSAVGSINRLTAAALVRGLGGC